VVPNPVFTEEYDSLRSILIGMRQKAGLSQHSLAAKLGRSGSHIALIEVGQRRLDILEFYNLAVALDVDPVSAAREVFAAFRQVQATSASPDEAP
jgi:transcriptional regulator with XRE-family HTH domain